MLRPLLLLGWAATIVSAGDLKNVYTSGTSVPASPNSYNATANLHSTSLLGSPELMNVETKPTSSSKDRQTTHESAETTVVITTPTTKSTTTKPTTTTTKPTTTTTKPTTTPAPTTTAAPTTPAPTTPLPPPSTGKWTVKENNTLCILVQMAGQFNVSITNAANVTIHKAMDIPKNGTISGTCGKVEQNLTLSWDSQNKTAENNTFTIHFVKNETGKYYSLHHLEISLAAQEFPNDKLNNTVTLVHMAPQFQTGLSNSYRCYKEQQMNLTFKDSNVTVGLLKVINLQFQAFRSDNTTIFGLAKDCSFDTPDIVPITVGCALAGLVVIVLIAYLVGRRRSQTRGYLSM